MRGGARLAHEAGESGKGGSALARCAYPRARFAYLISQGIGIAVDQVERRKSRRCHRVALDAPPPS